MHRLNYKYLVARLHRIPQKYKRIAGIVTICVAVLVLIGGYVVYIKREAILQHELARAKAAAWNNYRLELKVGSAHFTGLSTISCSAISIVPQQRDSLLSIQHFSVRIKLLPLIFGNIKLADVELQNGHLNLTSIKGVKNFDFLFKKRDTVQTTHTKVDLSQLSYRLINQVLYKIPDNLGLQNFLVSFADDSTRLKLFTPTALIDDGALTSTIKMDDGISPATWHLDGTMHPSDRDIDVHLYADGKRVELPIIEKKFHLKVSFDNITTRLSDVEHSSGETKIFGYWAVHNLVINHPGLAATDIIVPDGSIDANVFVGENYVSVDSSSVIHLKKITAHPFVKYTLSPSKIYELKLNTGWQNAQDVFDSFPGGMFESLEGMQVAGKLNYNLNLYLEKDKPDDVKFDSRLDKDGFRIVKYGRTDLSKLNHPFVYTAYEKGKPVRTFMVGPENPDYTPLDQIAPELRNAMMTSEDPTFYKNHGFVEESIRKSIATDIKQKKFKRGGSTISMQLVKNSFLSREKTLVRKIEEIFIVWLIENNDLMTKNRMLEVYFNIIELGPNVYGIGEASRYYFGKTPGQLTLGESIYLASILPHPKGGLYAFLPDGSLRPGLVNYFDLIGNLMAGQYLTKRDTTGSYGFYTVRLKESKRNEIIQVDSITATRLFLNNNNNSDDDNGNDIVIPMITEPEKKPNFLQRLFGKKDTVAQKINQQLKQEEKMKVQSIDTAGKSKKQIRQEKREIKKVEDARRKELKKQGIL